MQKIDWVMHLVKNGVRCAECSDVENGFLPMMCNAHTHGMDKYEHKDFQIVLDIQPDLIMYILNTLGLMVQSGRKFQHGELVEDVAEGYALKLVEVEETERQFLRVLIPDVNHKFPGEEGCEEAYGMQALSTEELVVKDGNPTIRIFQMLGDKPKHREFMYESLEYVKKNNNGIVPFELYEKVYEGKLGTGSLNEIDYIFNMKHPKDFKGHSLSVSDIIELEYKDGRKVTYYYDRVGFALLSYSKNSLLS